MSRKILRGKGTTEEREIKKGQNFYGLKGSKIRPKFLLRVPNWGG